MNVARMTTEELQGAMAELQELFDEIMPEYPLAARVVVDAMEILTEEIGCRAFGGGPEAREYVRKLNRERSGH